MFKTICIAILMLTLGGQVWAQAGPEQEMATTNVKVFPNPATSVLNVLGLKNADLAHILVLDEYGNTVLRHQWAIKNNALNLPVAQLQPGLYVVSIRSKEQQVNTRFLKN